jgi:hypothetical protein
VNLRLLAGRSAVALAVASWILSAGYADAQSACTNALADRLPVAVPIDDFLRQCPTRAEISRFRSDLDIRFSADPTAGTTGCVSDDGTALTPLEVAVYQALRVMDRMTFDTPLPWTSAPTLYAWLVGAIDGIELADDGPGAYSFCCEPANTIVIQVAASFSALETDRWMDPALGTGLDGLVGLLIHEARHNEIGGHTCGTNDATLQELGAWGTQAYANRWFALHVGGFLRMSSSPRGYYLAQALTSPERRSVCSTAGLDLSLAVDSERVDPLRALYGVKVTNVGTEVANDGVLIAHLPAGVTTEAVTTDGRWVCKAVLDTVRCTLATPLRPGRISTISMHLFNRAGGPITNVLTVTARGDVGFENDVACATTP